MTHDDATTEPALARLVADFFAAVTFEPGARPAYELIATLFIPTGLLIKNSGTEPEISSVAQFIAPREAMVRSGELTRFEEHELSATTTVFGNVAHRFSTYAKSGEMKGVAFDAKGMVSTQFVRTPQGWRMSAMAWDDERPGLSLPER